MELFSSLVLNIAPGGAANRWLEMVELVRNGYIGELKHMDVWCRNVTYDAGKYHVNPYGSTVEIPIPDDLNYDAWQGPSPMVPYTVDSSAIIASGVVCISILMIIVLNVLGL